MIPKFDEYLDSLGLKGDLVGRIEKIFEFYSEINSEEIKDIFVNEYLNVDGSREYISLWLLSDNLAMEAHNFIIDDVFDCVTIKNKIIRWRIEKQDYNFQDTTENSRFNLDITLERRTTGSFKSTAKNCSQLKEIFLKYIVPNLI